MSGGFKGLNPGKQGAQVSKPTGNPASQPLRFTGIATNAVSGR